MDFRKGGCFMDDMPGMDMPAASRGHNDQSPTFGTHGMVLVGEETLYLSHLPMFMSPHNFQVILEVKLEGEARGRLGDFRAHFGSSGLYTFKPEEFPITDLVSRDPGKLLSSFKGDLYQGHFEKGGRNIAEGAVVHVENVVFFEEFGPDSTKPSAPVYWLFGKGKEVFLAHWITQPPDFDQILSVNITGDEIADDKIPRAVNVTFLGRPNTPHERIKPGEKLSGRGHVTGAHQFLDLQVEVLREIYFEEGELRQPPTFDPTQEEKATGFGK
jgi:hypothetical protein